MTPEEEAEKYRYIKIKQAQQAALDPDADRMSYDDASKGDVAAEIGRSVGRGGQYAAEFFGDVYDVGRAAVDQMAPDSWGVEDRDLFDAINPMAPDSPADIARQEVYDRPALKQFTEEKIKRGGHAGLDAAKTFSEYILPTLTGGGGGAARKLAADVITTGVGAAGGEALGNVIAGHDAGEFGEIVGAIAGGFSGGWSQRKVSAAIDAVKNTINPKTGAKVTDAEAERVVQILMSASDDPELAVKNALEAFDKGDAGTFADATGDADFYNIEVNQKGSTQRRAIDRVSEEIEQQLTERIGGVTGVDSGASQGIAKSRAQQAGQRINTVTEDRKIAAAGAASEGLSQSRKLEENVANAAAAEGRFADEALSGAVLDVPMSKQSEKLADTYDLVSKRSRDKDVQPLWDDFDAHPPIKTKDLESTVDAMLDSLSGANKAKAERDFALELGIIKNWNTKETPKEIHGVVSSLKNTLKGLDSKEPHQAFMTGVTKYLDDFLENSTAGKTYVAARDAERKFQQRFNAGGLGKARRTSESGKLLASKLAKDLEAGAVTAQYVKQSGSPAIIKQVGDTLRALANRDIKTPAEINMFLRKYDEILTEFPDVKKDLTDAMEARLLADEADVVAKTTAKEQKTVRSGLSQARDKELSALDVTKTRAKGQLGISTLGQYAKNPAATLDSILASTAPLREMDELVRAVGKTPEGLNSLKAAIGDRFLKGASLEDFNRAKKTLQKVLNEDEMAVIESAMTGVASKRALRKAAGVQAQGVDKKELGNLVASGIAAMSMNIIPGSSLIMAGAVRRFVKEQLKRDPDPVLVKAMQELIDDPQRFKKALEEFKPSTPDGAGEAVWKAVKKAAGYGAKLTKSTLTAPVIVTSGDDEEFKGF